MWFIASDNVLTLVGLKDRITDEYVNDATSVVVTLYDGDDPAGLKGAASTAITGAEDLTLTYVEGRDGDYRGELPKEAELVPGTRYWGFCTVTSSGKQWTFIRVATAAYDVEGVA